MSYFFLFSRSLFPSSSHVNSYIQHTYSPSLYFSPSLPLSLSLLLTRLFSHPTHPFSLSGSLSLLLTCSFSHPNTPIFSLFLPLSLSFSPLFSILSSTLTFYSTHFESGNWLCKFACHQVCATDVTPEEKKRFQLMIKINLKRN
jgi:hypothetical protein